jgi:hypothetical protein
MIGYANQVSPPGDLARASSLSFRNEPRSSPCASKQTVTTKLEKTLKRELWIKDRPFVLAISPEGLKLTVKGRRKGQELKWVDLVSGEAALAVALNASVVNFASAAKVAVSPGYPEAPGQQRPPVRPPANPKRRRDRMR